LAKAAAGSSIKAIATAKTINFFIVPPFKIGKWLPVSPFQFHITTYNRCFFSTSFR
jgi:hypothetical protein